MKFAPGTLRWLFIGAVVGLALTATLVWAAPGAGLLPAPRTGYDPLSPDEQALARRLAFQQAEFARLVNAARQSEVLLIERHAETKAVMQSGQWPRRADVYVYLYDSDTLLHAVANLITRTVDSVETAQDAQLPLTQNETARAFQLLMADVTARADIAAQYQTITGEALTKPETQLKFSALIYRADSMPGANPGAAACGPRRCAQFLLATQDDIVINLLPIVDLSLGAVVSAGPFVGN
jgi:hypothetical protein